MKNIDTKIVFKIITYVYIVIALYFLIPFLIFWGIIDTHSLQATIFNIKNFFSTGWSLVAVFVFWIPFFGLIAGIILALLLGLKGIENDSKHAYILYILAALLLIIVGIWVQKLFLALIFVIILILCLIGYAYIYSKKKNKN